GVDLPCRRHLLGTAGAAGRNDVHLAQSVHATGLATQPDLHDIAHDASVLPVVVGGLDRHLDRVRVALPEPRGRDLDELGAVHLGDGRRSRVPHASPQAAVQLVQHLGDVTAVRDPALDALGDELLLGQDVVLEVAVL